MSPSEAFALIRAYAKAIAEGRIEAETVSEMTDEQLEDFRKAKLDDLSEAQEEAERLAESGD